MSKALLKVNKKVKKIMQTRVENKQASLKSQC